MCILENLNFKNIYKWKKLEENVSLQVIHTPYKCLFLGDSATGKSALLSMLKSNGTDLRRDYNMVNHNLIWVIYL